LAVDPLDPQEIALAGLFVRPGLGVLD